MRRLARPATALVMGGVVSLLALAEIPIAGSTGQLNISGDLLELVVVAVFVAVGTVVACKRPSNRIGWLLLAVAGLWCLSDLGSSYSVLDYRMHHGRWPLGAVAVLIDPSWAPTIALAMVTIVLYPEGKLPSPRWRWPMRGLGALAAAWILGAFAIVASAVITGAIHVAPGGDVYEIDRPTGHWAWWGMVQNIWFLALFVTFVAWLASQLISFRHLRGERRAQQKWLISGAAICFLSIFGSVFIHSRTLGAIVTVGVCAAPLAMGVGILKYRLYEIDRLISRTLSYAILTALLVGTFVGLVALTTDLLPFSSSVGVAASTLAAAAMFNPLRRRVQRAVDRRFNRSHYDAEATVAAFAARLRDAVDLDAVQADLLDAVRGAVEPAHATVWIRSQRPRSPETSHR